MFLMFLFHDHHSDNPCKFSKVAQQTQQQGRPSIKALRLCLTSAKNGGQCHFSITHVCWWKNHQSNQHQSTFNRFPMTLHCQHAPIYPMSLTHVGPLGHQLSQPGPAIHIIRGGWLSVTAATCPIQGKALVKNLNLNNFNEKNAPRSLRFCLRKSRWL